MTSRSDGGPVQAKARTDSVGALLSRELRWWWRAPAWACLVFGGMWVGKGAASVIAEKGVSYWGDDLVYGLLLVACGVFADITGMRRLRRSVAAREVGGAPSSDGAGQEGNAAHRGTGA